MSRRLLVIEDEAQSENGQVSTALQRDADFNCDHVSWDRRQLDCGRPIRDEHCFLRALFSSYPPGEQPHHNSTQGWADDDR